MFNVRRFVVSPLATFGLLVSVAAGTTILGCQRKERVVDIQTPAGDVHVDKDKDTGAVEVNVHDK